MSDIKSVLSLLCQHLKLSINVTMKPEYFRLAKFDDTPENVGETFWEALNILSYRVVQEKQIEVNFQHYDTVWATKLYFAYLQYPSIEFYAASKHDKNSRQLLLALAWLLGTQDALDTTIRVNLSNSVLGKECSKSNDSEAVYNLNEKEIEQAVPKTTVAQLNSMVHLHGKVNYNIREIYNLVSERANLISKVHAATMKVSGLPHLSVSELALIKRIATADKSELSRNDKKYIQELLAAGNLLDAHAKWRRKEHIFFEWMVDIRIDVLSGGIVMARLRTFMQNKNCHYQLQDVTVVQEHKKHSSSSSLDINWNEIFNFISVLHRVMQGRFEALSCQENHGCSNQTFESVSRLMRTEMGRDIMENRLTEMSAELEKETRNLSESKEKLSDELRKLLHLIPSCIQL
ncbi:tubulin epsilon and delta complex protein 1 isoform X1 [Lasioglossum baleicum]|uniref:tubulin epsilon and delta complex protein 1 isoform X1 n=1 Tax=Lasioglossum baleicum TaxID=434251 RepID=UPI003FCD5193